MTWHLLLNFQLKLIDLPQIVCSAGIDGALDHVNFKQPKILFFSLPSLHVDLDITSVKMYTNFSAKSKKWMDAIGLVNMDTTTDWPCLYNRNIL